ncbi:hypothetical protein CC78DRAFT_579535 [Lojkania enalia]|uniref:Lysine-specific metallo-endopeptidase domain-containing protein n=1 Tax=Lojkania enalia TaxID=147567 RepID=A0A9P4KCJ7_9PLEO|nr:hypothetical protein CC78DRAFT_579535 [Didymosphaeria enalia]
MYWFYFAVKQDLLLSLLTSSLHSLMHLKLSILLFLGRSILAAKWAIDGSCDLVGIADPGNGLDPFLQATDDLKKAMKEGITMAENAFKVMSDYTGDHHVAGILKLVLGEGADYQSKFDAVKETFENVMGYEKEHAENRPMDQGWQENMSWNDVMIFCSNDRIKQLGPNSLFRDTSMGNQPYLSMELKDNSIRAKCHGVDYNLQNTAGKIMAFTTPSDRFNKAGYLEAPKPKSIEDFTSPRPNIAFSIDVCTWFLHKSLEMGWPRIDKDRITQTQQPGFKGGVTNFATPVDGLRNTGLMMLHELTHTHQGGRLRDSDELPEGTPTCYGWKCVQDIKDPKNADNVAMLGLVLHLWTMGYSVDKDGNINSN